MNCQKALFVCVCEAEIEGEHEEDKERVVEEGNHEEYWKKQTNSPEMVQH